MRSARQGYQPAPHFPAASEASCSEPRTVCDQYPARSAEERHLRDLRPEPWRLARALPSLRPEPLSFGGVGPALTTVRRLSWCGAQVWEASVPRAQWSDGGRNIKLPSLTPADVVTKPLYGLTGMARA